MKAITIQKPPEIALKDILTRLFETKRIGAIFALTKKRENSYAYSLITNKELLTNITPLSPVMPMNAAKLISRLTIVESPNVPIAVIIRPCELRALYELVKLEQAKLDNLLFISLTCNGVFTLKSDTNDLAQRIEDYWKKTHTGEVVEGVRETCTMCTEFVPRNADIIVAHAGKNTPQKTDFIIMTEKGGKYLEGISDRYSEQSIESSEIEAIRQKRAAQKKTIFANLKTEELGFEGLTKVFGRCINCQACRSVCPICYCTLCYINSTEKDTLPLTWERQLKKKGSLRIPSDTVMYQLVRMLHVSVMCVGCGMCSDICPTDIPVASIFTKISERIQESLEYKPGNDLEQAMPLAVVNPEDFAESDSELT